MARAAVVRTIWAHFTGSAPPPGHALDITGQSAAETISAIREGPAAGRYALAEVG
ncbi:MAG TPA: hypothetical protein VIE16_12770 [Phenylobacterium sp.]